MSREEYLERRRAERARTQDRNAARAAAWAPTWNSDFHAASRFENARRLDRPAIMRMPNVLNEWTDYTE